MVHWLFIHWLFTLTIIHLVISQGQPCTRGFLSEDEVSVPSHCSSGQCSRHEQANTIVALIIPDINFTCTGVVVKWRAAGDFGTGTKNVKIVIWRPRNVQENTYDRVSMQIELGVCENGTRATAVPALSNVYECTLPETHRVSVQPGDIIGAEIPGNQQHFRLYFDNFRGPPNYRHVTFESDPPTLEVTLDSRLSRPPRDLPLLALLVEPDLTTSTKIPTSTELKNIMISTTAVTSLLVTLPEETTISQTEVTRSDTTTESASADPTRNTLPQSPGLITGVVAGAVAGVIIILILSLSAVIIFGLVCLMKYKRASCEEHLQSSRGKTSKQLQSDNFVKDKENGWDMKTKDNVCYVSAMTTDVNAAYGTRGYEDQQVYDYIY